MRYDNEIFINDRKISLETKTYFIADIASNHDGSLDRAKKLICLSKESGADAVKFQHFKANKIVSDYGFKSLGKNIGHQSSWDKSVFEIYQQYECSRDWNDVLIATAKQVGINFLTTPYDLEAVEMFDNYLPAYKIGSGDITWIDFIDAIAKKGKPVLLATGASAQEDVVRAVDAVLKHNRQIILMQCNTNYTGTKETFHHINLNVLKSYWIQYPQMILGLSDHSPGHAAVLGGIALGARVIEKHFTDDNSRSGPDHAFSMNPDTWREMIEKSRELEFALGDGIKRIERNETDTAIVQRRCLRLTKNMNPGEQLHKGDLEALRPAPKGGLEPYHLKNVMGKTLVIAKKAGDAITINDIEE